MKKTVSLFMLCCTCYLNAQLRFTVYFDFNAAEISSSSSKELEGIVLPQSRASLEELLRILKDNPTLKIDIQGHICCQKIEENQISLRRAAAVYAYLVKGGINKIRLTYKSFASTHPIYPLPEKTEEERVANRRVEIEIVEK